MGTVECLTSISSDRIGLQRFDYHILGSVTLITAVTGCIRAQLAHSMMVDCRRASSPQVRRFVVGTDSQWRGSRSGNLGMSFG
jgi:hypothetical protein